MMKVSLITTCRDSAATIKDTIDSVLAQDWPSIEHIVVDGGSRDHTQDVIRQYEAESRTEDFRRKHQGLRVRVELDRELGLYEGLNRGMELATGDIIGVIHSDDMLFSPHVVRDVAEEMERSGADLLYADGIYVECADTRNVVRSWIGGSYSKGKIRRGWLPLHTTCYMRSAFAREVGTYNEDYQIASDTDYLLRALYERSPRVTYLPQYVVRMRMGGKSTTRSRFGDMWREDVRIYNSHGFPGTLMKLMKMSRKVPQFVTAKLKKHD